MEKSKFMEVIMNKSKVDGLWDCVEDSTTSDHGEEVAGGTAAAGVFPWPPRSYTCSFCKRQFRSAQALGGHMNIHRRDRARLRQSSPPTPRDISGNGQLSFLNLNLNLEPNPNPNLNFNTTNPNYSTKCPNNSLPHPFTSRLPPFFASRPLSLTPPSASKDGMISQTHKDPNFGKIRATKRVLDHQNELGNISAVSLKDGKREEFVRLELEIGLIGEENEDLDLELRLGYT